LDAFEKQDQVTLMEYVDGKWVPWLLDFPPNDAVPGDGGLFLSPWEFVRTLLRWMVDKHAQGSRPVAAASSPAPPHAPRIVGWVEQVLRETAIWIDAAATTTVETTEAVTLVAAHSTSHALLLH